MENNPTVEFDSDEEEYFSNYLEELEASGIVISWKRHDTLVLAEKAEMNGKFLFHPQTYTPDFEVVWNKDSPHLDKFCSVLGLKKIKTPFKGFFRDGSLVSVLEIKGGFTDHDEGRIYSILSKWVWDKFAMPVHRVIVSNQKNSIFNATFTPNQFLLTKKTRKPRKIHFTPKTLSQFLNL